jgi:DnaJ-class molecular chaperone
MIKAQYRALIKQWHPDTCPEDQEICHEMTQKIIAAYGEIMAYCNQYSISFTQEAMKSYLSPEERWMEQFGENFM